jgi:hypothetical protein
VICDPPLPWKRSPQKNGLRSAVKARLVDDGVRHLNSPVRRALITVLIRLLLKGA